MNSWANVGDLVFVLSRDNEPIPCKVINEISGQLFFKPVIDEDIIKIPKTRLKAFMNQVGFAGGYVFKEKQNALDYLDEVKLKGSFNMSSIISKKTKRAQQRLAKESNTQLINVQKIKEDATNEAVNRVHKTVIAAMLIALNSELGIGHKRGLQVVNEIDRLIQEVADGKRTQESLLQNAEEKMKIKLGGN